MQLASLQKKKEEREAYSCQLVIDIEAAEDPEMKMKLSQLRELVLRSIEAYEDSLLKLEQYIDATQKLLDLYEKHFAPAA